MSESTLVTLFLNINTWKSNGERAPHKPLLLLLALGKLQQGESDFMPYAEVEEKLKDLLIDFGRPQKNVRPHYSFIRLANDGIWTLDKVIQVNSSGDASPKELREKQVGGKFTEEITQQLKQNPQLFREVVQRLLDENFPDTIHQDILDAVGIELDKLGGSFQVRRIRKRDPQFRESILRAYEYQCAVCGFGVRLKHKVLALEAAHIMWHQAGGPDVEVNGLALCATHHKLFDLGAFTVNPDLRLLVSDEVNGIGANEWLLQHHGKSIRAPQKKSFYPSPDFTIWHVNEVFKGGYRDV
ncbi:phosphorothioated DNA-binding restriction endonuclease [Pontibacter indicus]|uniref:Putative restriction endonuclease n=1 Tax=Pontibacter indicus TaxID=1317125 RepID=A0A1R3WUH0_9BACT|nr:HNH endonuclease [Pontibacter indicus]SIT82002.1 putative restriction endonuclease [Pontibacter indicus]